MHSIRIILVLALIGAVLPGCGAREQTKKAVPTPPPPPTLPEKLRNKIENKSTPPSTPQSTPQSTRETQEHSHDHSHEESKERISVDAAKAEVEKGTAIIVDVRSETQFKAGHIKGAKWIPEEEIGSRVKELPKNKKIITYCS
jgi:hypothetical protein